MSSLCSLMKYCVQAWYIVIQIVIAMIVTTMAITVVTVTAMILTMVNTTQHRHSCTTGNRGEAEHISICMKMCCGDVMPAGAWHRRHVPV